MHVLVFAFLTFWTGSTAYEVDKQYNDNHFQPSQEQVVHHNSK